MIEQQCDLYSFCELEYSKGATKSRNKSLENITKLPFFVRKIKSSKVKRDQLSHSIDHMPKDYVHVCSIFIFLFLSLF